MNAKATKLKYIFSLCAMLVVIICLVLFNSSTNKSMANSSKISDSGETNTTIREVITEVNYETYETVEELDNGADVILIGSPTKEFEEREHVIKFTEPNGLITNKHISDYYTLSEIKVKKILKEDSRLQTKLNGDLLKVIEPLAIVDYGEEKVKLMREGYTEMKKNSRYIIFLKKNTNGDYSVINMSKGKFNLDDTDTEDILYVHGGHKDVDDRKVKLKEQIIEKYKIKEKE